MYDRDPNNYTQHGTETVHSSTKGLPSLILAFPVSRSSSYVTHTPENNIHNLVILISYSTCGTIPVHYYTKYNIYTVCRSTAWNGECSQSHSPPSSSPSPVVPFCTLAVSPSQADWKHSPLSLLPWNASQDEDTLHLNEQRHDCCHHVWCSVNTVYELMSLR